VVKKILEKEIFKSIGVEALWYADTTAPKAFIGSDVVFACDAVLLVRVRDLPRRPVTNELLYYPRANARLRM
jgi:hypothetical protein